LTGTIRSIMVESVFRDYRDFAILSTNADQRYNCPTH
jgi:hypothetical protein